MGDGTATLDQVLPGSALTLLRASNEEDEA
jgi:hypothetical protein